jgi:hypothetical protein
LTVWNCWTYCFSKLQYDKKKIVYHNIIYYITNMAGILSEATTAYPSRVTEFTSGCLVWVRGAHLFSFLCCPIISFYVLSSVLWCLIRFPHKNDVRFVFISSCLYEGSCLIIFGVCLCIVMSNKKTNPPPKKTNKTKIKQNTEI